MTGPKTGTKERLLIISRNFPPLIGGMEKLIYNVYSGLCNAYQISTITPKGSQRHLNTTDRALEVRPSPISLFLIFSFIKGFFASLTIKPKIIISGSGVTAPASVFAGWVANAKVVCFIHGLDIIADSFIYQKIFVPAIARSTTIIANSQNTERLITEHGISKDKIIVIHPGAHLPDWPIPLQPQLIINDIDLATAPVILSLGRLTPRKGLLEFVERCMPTIHQHVPEAKFLVVGEDASQALNGTSKIKTQLEQLCLKLNLSKTVIIAGFQDSKTIEKIYAHTNVFVFPVLDLANDVEGFGMVAIEAAAQGVPTVAFAAGGVPDAVSENRSGHLIKPGSYEAFSDAVIKTISNPDISAQSCRQFSENFSWSHFNSKLSDILKSL